MRTDKLVRHHFRPSATAIVTLHDALLQNCQGWIVTFLPSWLFPIRAMERQQRRYTGDSDTGK